MLFKNDEEEKRDNLERDIAKRLLNDMFEVTGEPCLEFKINCVELDDILSSLAISFHTISQLQFKELTNIVKQFKEVVDNYIKENNIKLEE